MKLTALIGIMLYSVFTASPTLATDVKTTSNKQDMSRPIKILCLGDSLTEGYGLAKEEAWPSLVEQQLQAKGWKNLRAINAGISGSTSASGPGRLKWHLKGSNKPDFLVLALGANDGLRGTTVESTSKNLEEVILAATGAGIKVLLAGMKMPPNYGKAYTEAFEKIFPDLAKKHGLILIPFMLDGVAGDPKLNLPDGIHPNAAGNKIVASTILKYLEPAL